MFEIIVISADGAIRQETDRFMREWNDGDGFIHAHTSGSTGTPKDILLPKGDMLVSARATVARFGLDSDSTLLSPLSPAYIAGKMMIVRGIVADCRVIFCEPSNRFLRNKEVADAISRYGIDLLPVVPSQLADIIEMAAEHEESGTPPHLNPIRNIRNLIIGGAPLSQEDEHLLMLSLPPEVSTFATFGMTETCSHIALRRIGDNYFKGMPGVTFATDQRGCLIIDAPAYSFGRLVTNDIVTLAGNERFRWEGRYDNVIISGGLKIFPEQLERRLSGALPGGFYIKKEADQKWGETPVMVVEESVQLTDSEILEICRRLLQRHEIPSRIIRVKEIPLTSNGKLRRI